MAQLKAISPVVMAQLKAISTAVMAQLKVISPAVMAQLKVISPKLLGLRDENDKEIIPRSELPSFQVQVRNSTL